MRPYHREATRRAHRHHLQLTHEDGELEDHVFEMDDGWPEEVEEPQVEPPEVWPAPEVQIAVDSILNGVAGLEAAGHLMAKRGTHYQVAWMLHWLLRGTSLSADSWTMLRYRDIYSDYRIESDSCAACGGRVWNGSPHCVFCGVGPLCWQHDHQAEMVGPLCPLCMFTEQA